MLGGRVMDIGTRVRVKDLDPLRHRDVKTGIGTVIGFVDEFGFGIERLIILFDDDAFVWKDGRPYHPTEPHSVSPKHVEPVGAAG